MEPTLVLPPKSNIRLIVRDSFTVSENGLSVWHLSLKGKHVTDPNVMYVTNSMSLLINMKTSDVDKCDMLIN